MKKPFTTKKIVKTIISISKSKNCTIFRGRNKYFFGMMRTKILFFQLIALFVLSNAIGQDLHFSYYQFAPLDVNPANSGAFAGSYRINGIYTNKGFSISPQGYQTFSLSADAPIIRGIRKQDWVGIGFKMDVLNAANNSGTRQLDNLNDPVQAIQNWMFMKISAAYHLSLDKKQTNIITLGAQVASSNRFFNFGNQETRYGMMGLGDDPEVRYLKANKYGTDSDNKLTFRDLNIGLLYNARRKKSDFRLGFAVGGILNPRTGLYSKNNQAQSSDTSKVDPERKPIALNIHGEYRMDITPRTSIVPAFYYYSLGKANAFNVNTHAWYQVNPDMDFKAGAGLGIRNVRDLILYLGAEMKGIQVGLAYDLNIDSRAIGSDGFGGFEICARYLGKIYKKPKVKPVIFCPRL